MKTLTTVLELAGMAAIVAGVALIWIPAAVILGGIALIWTSYSLTLDPRKATK